MRQSSNPILLVIAFTLVVAALVGFIAYSIEAYNQEVAEKQREIANATMGIRLVADSFYTDHRPFYRVYLLLISALVLLLLTSSRLMKFALFLPLVSMPIIYLWISTTARDLQFAENYMTDTPYLLRIASSSDWVVFGLFGLLSTCIFVKLVAARKIFIPLS